ncbi:hypothetical protein BT69DRAFT_661861 [Atractiella rhizophila]|nr:hypothetical protein BT69DRAFT_661861 [Atractiella rhizophila]
MDIGEACLLSLAHRCAFVSPAFQHHSSRPEICPELQGRVMAKGTVAQMGSERRVRSRIPHSFPAFCPFSRSLPLPRQLIPFTKPFPLSLTYVHSREALQMIKKVGRGMNSIRDRRRTWTVTVSVPLLLPHLPSRSTSAAVQPSFRCPPACFLISRSTMKWLMEKEEDNVGSVGSGTTSGPLGLHPLMLLSLCPPYRYSSSVI